MANIVPFSEAGLPSTIVGRKRLIDVNKDIVTAAQFPSLSIKGKVFTLVQDSERRVLTKPEDPDEVLQAVNMSFLRINMTSKTFYKKQYSEEDSEGARPDCFSHDGVTPSPNSPDKQAEKCATCKHNEWGSRVGSDGTNRNGRACADHARIAIADPRHLEKAMLLRVPPASLKPLKDALKMVKARQLQYNEVVFRVGFDREAPSPKLTFKPVGVLDDATYGKACEQFESETVRAICGLDESANAAPAPAPAPVEADELDAALASREAARKEPAKPKVEEDELSSILGSPAPAPKPAARKRVEKPEPAQEAPKASPAPAPVMAAGDDDLLGELDGLLGSTDD